MKRHLVIYTVMLLCASSPALANLTGIELKNACDSPLQTPGNGLCFGYLMGALDAFRFVHHFNGVKYVCDIPKNVDAEQDLLLIRKYLNDHPQYLNLTAASLIPHIINEAFPCRK